MRVGYLVIALIHVALAATAFALASGGQGKGDDSAPGWTAQLMSQPFGQWLVAVLGAIVFVYETFFLPLMLLIGMWTAAKFSPMREEIVQIAGIAVCISAS